MKEDMGDQLKAVELPKRTLSKLPKRTLSKLPKRTLRSIESTVKPADTDTPWDYRKNPVFKVCRCVKTKCLVMMENC